MNHKFTVSMRRLFTFVLLSWSASVFAQPTATVVLTENTIPFGGLTRWTLTLDNSAGVSPAENLQFSFSLPTGVTVSSIPRGDSDCAGGTVTAVPGSTSISLADGRLGAGDACDIALDLEGGNSSSTLPTFDVDSNLGTAAANAVDLTADNSVVVTDLQFSPTTSTVGQLVRTTATITVPTEYNLSGSFSFSVTLPDGLQVASIPNSEASCSEANAQLDFSSIDFSPGAIEITWSQNIYTFSSFLPLSGDTTCTLAFDAQVTGLGDLQAGSSGLTGVASFNPSSASSVSNIASFGTARIATTNSDLYLSHSFSPALVSTGSAVTADYVITNTTRDTATSIQFSHDLGAIDCVDTNGACPSNAPGWVPTNLPLSDVCGVGSSLSEENPGVITLSGASINSSESCSFSVTTQLPGTESEGVYTSTISDLSGSGLSGGESQAALRIQTGVEVSFEFDGSPSKIGAGTPNNLIVTLSNASATLSATEVSGTINLPAEFPSGSVVAPAAGSCGPGSSFGTTADSFGNVALRFTNATLNANDSCSLTYAVESVEGYDGAAVFLADDVVFTANSQVFESPQFNYSIEVTAPPRITLVTSASSVSKGDSFDLMLAFEDEDRDRENIGLTLDVEAVLPGQTPGDNMVLASNSCVGGSFALVDGVLTVSGLEEQDCEASVTVTPASTAALGSKTFSATAISATDGGIFGEGSDLSATVQVGALIAAVSVSPSIALPTDDLTLTYTLQNASSSDSIGSAQFTDNYSSFFSGASGTLVSTSSCGTPTVNGTTFFVFSGITVDPSTTCTITVSLSNPSNTQGTFRSTPGTISYTQDGSGLTADMAGDVVTINSSLLGLSLILSPEVVMPGGSLSLSAVLSNGSAVAITGGAFDVDINAVIAGATISTLPANGFCGAGSSAIQSSPGVLRVSGIEKAAGLACTLDGVLIAIPVDASPGNYVLTSGALTADNGITGPTGSVQFGVGSIQAQRSVDSTSSIIFPGAGFEVDYSLTNLGSTALDGISFSDDLSSPLGGVSVDDMPLSDVCGSGSQLTSSSGTLALQGASLAAGANCDFSVTVQLPPTAGLGAATLAVVDVRSNGIKAGELVASTVTVEAMPVVTLGSAGGVSAGQADRVTATLDNTGSSLAATAANFAATLPLGLVVDATTAASSTCIGGTLTAADGETTVSYNSGVIPAGTSCSVIFDVTAAQTGTYSVSTDLTTSAGTSELVNIDVYFAPLPVFSLSATPAALAKGDGLVATYTIDNSASPLVLSSTSFTHNLQGGLQVAGAATFTAGSCPNTAVTATVGSVLVSVDVGAAGVGPNSSCVIEVPLATTLGGGDLQLITDQLSSSAGVIAAASTTVNINGAPVLDSIGNKGVAEGATLTFTVSATDADLPADTLVFAMTDGPGSSSFDAGTQIFTWTPGEADHGTASATFRVTDNGTGALFDEETITITVAEVNLPPTLGPIANQTVNEGELLTLTLTAGDSDVPVQNLSFGLDSGPDGMTVDAGTGVLSWTPTEGQGPGDYLVTVSVTDDGAPPQKSSQGFTVTVNEVNTAPVLSPIGNKSTAEETALTFTVSASDDDLPAQTLTYSMTGAPTGATLDGSTGAFSWTPTEAQSPSETQVTFVVTDDGDPALSAQETITITVTNTNKAPVLSPIGNKSTAEETALTFTVSASDDDLPAQTLTYSMTGAPTGATLDGSTGAFSWTPTEAQSPSETQVTFVVTDDGDPALSAQETITITVTNTNKAPVLSPIGNKSTAEETALTFTVSASDDDLPAQTLTYSMTGAPTGATLDGSTGAFSWTPTEAQSPSETQVTFVVTDDGDPALSAQETITITVTNTNKAPVLSPIGNKSTAEETALTFTVSASDDDLPAQTLTYSMTGAPTGATLDGSTGAFSWTPTEAQSPSETQVTFVVTDDGDPALSAQETITITVTNTNKAPVLSPIGNKSTAEETALTFTVSASDDDLPAQTLTYSMTGAPTGATLDGSTGAFSWTPTEAQSPSETQVTFVVTDDGDPALSAQETITITVTNTNKAPVLSPIGNKSTAEETALTFTVSASDDDLPAQTLTYSMTGAPTGATLDGSTGAFSWTPTEAQSPSETQVTFVVTDDGDPALSAQETITITVTNTNKAPVLSPIGNKSTAEETALTFTVSASDDDLPAQTLTYSMTGAPTGATLDGSTGAFSWTPTEAQSPSETQVTFVVTDDGDPALSAQETITITVTNTNKAPVLSPIGNKSTAEETALTFTVSASDDDLPAQTLTYSMTGAPTGATLDGSTGAFSWTPTEAQSPSETQVTFVVTDDGDPALSAQETITITVTNTNKAPVLSPIGNKSTAEETALTFTVSASDDDLPAQTLTYSMTGAPTGATLDGSTGAFSWTPTEAQSPSETQVTFVVTDDGDPALSAQETITITVTNTNKAPVLSPIGNKSTAEETALTFTVSASDDDLPAQTLTYSMTGAPTGATLDGSTGAFSWTPTEAQSPSETQVTFVVTDDGDPALSAQETITITVTNTNKAPVLSPIADQALSEGDTLTLTLTATDTDEPAQELVYSLTAGPEGMAVNVETGELVWTPSETQGPGDYSVSVTVTDNGSPPLSDTGSFMVTVEEFNESPVLGPIDLQSLVEGQLLALTLSVTDADVPANEFAFSLLNAPDGMTVDADTGVINWQTNFGDAGMYTITAVVTDSGDPARSAEASFEVTVAPRSSVLTFPNGSPGQVTLNTENPDSTCQFSGPVTAVSEDSVSPAPPSRFSFVNGLIRFTAVSCGIGETAFITIDYEQPLAGNVVVYKTGEPYVELPTQQAGTTVTYQITDGGLGDADGVANGEIIDPAGAVFVSSTAAAQIPTLSLAALLLLVMGMLLIAGQRISAPAVARYNAKEDTRR